MFKKFDPHLLTGDDLRDLAQRLVDLIDNHTTIKKYSEPELRVIWAILTVVGFDVTAITREDMECEGAVINSKTNLVLMTCYWGKFGKDEKATRWLNDIFDYVCGQIHLNTMANRDRIVDEVLTKVEWATPLKPISLVKDGKEPDVLMMLPVKKNPDAKYVWFVQNFRSGDSMPEAESDIGIHGPICKGTLHRTAKGANKKKHLLVCDCGFKVSIPNYELTYEELREGIQNEFIFEGKFEKKSNPNMRRLGPRPKMRKKVVI